MKSQERFLLDRFESPKILAGPHASAASRPAALALRDDRDYQELASRLHAVGFFTGSAWRFGWRVVVFTAAYAAGFAYLLTGPSAAGCALACLVIGFAHIHGNFLAHDASHGAVTKRRGVAEALGQFFDSFLGGYSFTYFRRTHDLHHYHCNEVDRDPNTMTTMFAVSEQARREKTGANRLTTRWQHVLIPLLYPLWSFPLRVEGIAYVARHWRTAWVDAVLLVAHHALWLLPVFALGWSGALLCYVGVNLVTGSYLGAIVPMNHIGLPTLDSATAPQSFVEQQLTTSRNVTSSPVRDFLYMGQNSQIEHHLFPFAPTFNLSRGRAVVREFCRERGLPYHECSYLAALKEVHAHYARLAR